MVSKLIKKFEPELNRLGVKHNLTKSEIEFILTCFFDDLKSFITDVRMPKIKITNLGTFAPSIAQINRVLYKSFYWRALGRKSEDKLRILIKKVWKIRRRLQEEKKGRVTFAEWHGKSQDFLEW